MLAKSLENLGTKKIIPKNKLLFSAGDQANGFYYVESGEIRIYKMDPAGKEIEVNRLTKGDYFGEIILFVADKFPVYAEAIVPSVVYFFPKNNILTALDKNPVLAKFFIKLLAQKCLTLNQRLENMTLQTVRQRLIQYLLNLCPGNGNCIIKLTLKKQELAKQLGTISATLSRNLKQLEKEQLLAVQGKNIIIKNCAALKKEINL